MVPEGVTVVAALHTISAPTLADLDAELDEDVLVCGDRKADKARVARLIELIPGLRAVNAGPLEMARIVEQLTPMLISINVRYKTHAGIRITGLPDGDHWELATPVQASRCSPAAPAAPSSAPGMQEEIGADLAVIANTGDDIEILGVHVSPDPDLVTYWLSRRNRRRARLGDPRRHLHRLRAAGAARRPGLVRPLRPRPRRPACYRRQFLDEGGTPDRRPGADRRARSASRRGCCRCATQPVRTKVLTAGGLAGAAGVPDRRPRRARGRRRSSSRGSPTAEPTPGGARGARAAPRRS